PLADLGCDDLAGRARIDRHLAVKQLHGIEETKDDIGVGDGRLSAATAIAGRAGIGACAAWADAKDPATVDPREAAAAGTNFGKIDGRRANEVTTALEQALSDVDACADLHLLRDARLAAFYQTGLGGRTAHVERDDVLLIEALPQRGGADGAGRGSRLEAEGRKF